MSLWACYVDEAGCTGVLPHSRSVIQPAFILVGIIIEIDSLPRVTADFISLKKRFNPKINKFSRFALNAILYEIKGADLRRDIRGPKRRARSNAIGFLDGIFTLLESFTIKVIGRILIKDIGTPINGQSVYTSSVQAICTSFHRFLEDVDGKGIVIADGRHAHQNSQVDHSIFTKI